MKKEFSIEESLVNRLVLHSQDHPNLIGLLSGQMGIIVVLARYSRQKNIPQIEDIADFLYENVMKRIRTMHNIDFSSGLSGICWGIEYLVQKGILDGCGHDICESADRIIVKTDLETLNDYSLETGILGLWHYIWARIQGNLMHGYDLPFNYEYLLSWKNLISKHRNIFHKDYIKHLDAAMNGKLIPVELNLKQFIYKNVEDLLLDDMSLQKGVSGYIELNYLK